MQKLTTILDILNKRSLNNHIIDRLYRNLYNKEFYIEAYDRLSNVNSNVKEKDDLLLKRIDEIIKEMKYEKYNWVTPDSIKYTNAFNTLPISQWKDKLVQEVLKILLTSIYEPKFLDSSHAYRKNKGCYTALKRIYQKGQACSFFIKFEIKDLFNSINNSILLKILNRDIKDGRFIEVMRKMLKSYKFNNDFVFNKTYSGIPKGGIIFPLLSNIYLNELDNFVENDLISNWNIGEERKRTKEYRSIEWNIYKSSKLLNDGIDDKLERDKIIKELKDYKLKRRSIRSKVKYSEDSYRRLTYTRYADKFILTFSGTYKEALDISNQIKDYLFNTLSLDSSFQIIKSTDKKQPVEFLGYNLIVQYNDNKLLPNGKRSLSGQIAFLVPRKVITENIKEYCKNGKPIHISYLVNNPVFDIIKYYQLKVKGLIDYYKYARNRDSLTKLKYIAEISLTKTLAYKLRTSIPKIYKKYSTIKYINGFNYKVLSTIITKDNKTYESYFGGISFKVERIINSSSYLDDTIPNTFITKINVRYVDLMIGFNCII